MNIKVGELEEHLAKRKESAVTAKLGDFTVADDATLLFHGDGFDKKQWVLDETAATALNKYLKVPAPYYKKLDPTERAQVLRWEIERNKAADTTAETLNDDLIAVHSPDQIMLPLAGVAGVVSKVFQPEDTIRRVIINDQRFHLDVTSDAHKLVLPSKEDTNVGDITEAGVRFLAYPFRTHPPSTSAYAERLICMNGQTTPESLGRISLKGQTVDEVILEMEEAAGLVLGQLDDYLEKLAATRDMSVPGTAQSFAAQLAREAKLPAAVLHRVLDIINQLPAPISVWDVNQAFTTVANEEVTYANMVRLQNVGGALAFSAEKAIERCTTCERLL